MSRYLVTAVWGDAPGRKVRYTYYTVKRSTMDNAIAEVHDRFDIGCGDSTVQRGRYDESDVEIRVQGLIARKSLMRVHITRAHGLKSSVLDSAVRWD